MTFIKEITAEQTYAVRHPVLRPGKPIESCRFDADNDPGTVHLGLYDNGELAAVATIVQKSTPTFTEANQFQLRGMAVLEHHQKKGYGAQLLAYAENDVRQKNATVFWFNSRIIAVEFYKKLGYRQIGDTFDIGDIGAHYIMYKYL